MRIIAITVLLLAAPLSQAACGQLSKLAVPEIPSGMESTLTEMSASRKEIQKYVETGESYIACSSAPDFYKNHMIEKLEDVAGRFNAEIERFSIATGIAG
jgi:hypothetical protein